MVFVVPTYVFNTGGELIFHRVLSITWGIPICRNFATTGFRDNNIYNNLFNLFLTVCDNSAGMFLGKITFLLSMALEFVYKLDSFCYFILTAEIHD